MVEDVRWHQRFENFTKALAALKESVDLAAERPLSRIEKQGLIQAFEFTYELAWSTVKDFYEYRGETGIHGSRDAFRLAFERGLVANGQGLMNSIKSRQLTSHTYNEETADEIYRSVIAEYYGAFTGLALALEREKLKEK
jgi:nucleotidyltransferase substrate binding protein (TIGR01987 family)